jgi:hypothetical protein
MPLAIGPHAVQIYPSRTTELLPAAGSDEARVHDSPACTAAAARRIAIRGQFDRRRITNLRPKYTQCPAYWLIKRLTLDVRNHLFVKSLELFP